MIVLGQFVIRYDDDLLVVIMCPEDKFSYEKFKYFNTDEKFSAVKINHLQIN